MLTLMTTYTGMEAWNHMLARISSQHVLCWQPAAAARLCEMQTSERIDSHLPGGRMISFFVSHLPLKRVPLCGRAARGLNLKPLRSCELGAFFILQLCSAILESNRVAA